MKVIQDLRCGSHTSSLQEYGSAREYTALQPSHTVTEIIQADFLAPSSLPCAGNRDLALGAIREGNLDHHTIASVVTSRTAGATTIDFGIVVVEVFLEEAATGSTRRRALHLAREIAAREHGGTLAERVRNLLCVNILECDADPQTTAALVVVNEYKFPLLGIGDVGKQVIGGLVVVSRAVARRNCAVVGRRRNGTRAGVAGVWVWVAGENLGLANVVPMAGTGAGWGLVVVVVTLIHVLSVPCKRQSS